MSNYQEIDGDLISLAKKGNFDVIAHGCNCHCTMGAGIAPQMAKAFGADTFPMENSKYKGDINKLGTIDYQIRMISPEGISRTIIEGLKFMNMKDEALVFVNAYTQYNYAKGNQKPIDYEALTLCMRKINNTFKGNHIGLPKIGAGLAGGDWERIKKIIKSELSDCKVTIVNYKP